MADSTLVVAGKPKVGGGIWTAPLDFNPRTHVGCDTSAGTSAGGLLDFNPRTHVGCDKRAPVVA